MSIRNKRLKNRIKNKLIILPDDISEKELLNEIEKLNHNTEINGILVQSPLPKHIDEIKIFNHVIHSKDVDGFNTINVGKTI